MTMMPEELREIPDDVRPLIDWARGSKDDLVGRTPAGENDDLCPVIDVQRDGETIGIINCRHVSRDEALAGVNLAVPGWSADHVIVLLDAHMADQSFMEKYGRVPDPGELQDLCDKEGACDLGLITDCILIAEAWRGGRQRMTQVPYHVHKTARTVHWFDDERLTSMDTATLGPEAHLSGLVFDGLAYAFARPTMDEKTSDPDDPLNNFDPTQFGFTDPGDPAIQIHKDLAVLSLLTMSGYAVAFACHTPLHKELMERMLEHQAGMATIDQDGTVRESKAEPSLLNLLGAGMREDLDRAIAEGRQKDLEAREQRRAERAAGRGETVQETFERITGHKEQR